MWEQLDSGRVVHRFEGVVLGATLALIPVFILEAEATSSRWENIAFAANWLIWLVFAVELALLLVVAPRKAAALRALPGGRSHSPHTFASIAPKTAHILFANRQ